MRPRALWASESRSSEKSRGLRVVGLQHEEAQHFGTGGLKHVPQQHEVTRAACSSSPCSPAACRRASSGSRRCSRRRPGTGRTRSRDAGTPKSAPPPWMSKGSPRYLRLMAEHSMCQPGRPMPQGLSQAGSPGLAAFFHRAKSSGSRLRSSRPAPSARSSRWPPSISSMLRPGELAVLGIAADAEVHVAVLLVGVTFGDELLHESDRLGDSPVWRRAAPSGSITPSRRMSSMNASAYSRATSAALRPSSLALLMILPIDVGDVLHEGDVEAAPCQIAADDVEGDESARVSDVDVVVHGGTADVHAHASELQGMEIDFLPKLRIVKTDHAAMPFFGFVGMRKVVEEGGPSATSQAQGHGAGGDALLAPFEAQMLGGGGLHAHVLHGNAHGGRQVLRASARGREKASGACGGDHAVHVHDGESLRRAPCPPRPPAA